MGLPWVHFFGLNDTGALFALERYFHFPDEGAGGKCNKEFWKKWLPRRASHSLFVASLWACVWLLGTWPLGRPISEGWRFMLTVSCCARIGFSAAWMFITNFTHPHPWNEMLFHDLHHAFPNAVGTLSQRGRFHGWSKVHEASVEVLARGLWKANGDEETHMQKTQKKRSMLMKNNRSTQK